MSNIHRRLVKAEKQLHIEKPHIVNIAGMEIISDELGKLLKEINGKSRGLPCEEKFRKYQTIHARGAEI